MPQKTLQSLITAISTGGLDRKGLSGEQRKTFNRQAERSSAPVLRRAVSALMHAWSRERRKNDKLQERVDRLLKDELTKLFNRHGLRDELLEMDQSEDQNFAITLIDLDNFKRVNDTLGHEAGDKVLIDVAERLVGSASRKSIVKKDDMVARVGGDEILIVMRLSDPNSFDEEKIKKRIRNAFKGLYVHDPKKAEILPVGASIGVVQHEGILDYATLKTLIKQADVKVYEDKDRKAARLNRATRSIMAGRDRGNYPEPIATG